VRRVINRCPMKEKESSIQEGPRCLDCQVPIDRGQNTMSHADSSDTAIQLLFTPSKTGDLGRTKPVQLMNPLARVGWILYCHRPLLDGLSVVIRCPPQDSWSSAVARFMPHIFLSKRNAKGDVIYEPRITGSCSPPLCLMASAPVIGLAIAFYITPTR
jgi:hypothetical protein